MKETIKDQYEVVSLEQTYILVTANYTTFLGRLKRELQKII